MLKKLSVIFVVYMMLITGSLINVSAEEYDGFEYTIENNEATVTGYKGSYEKNLKIPSEINGYKVTKLDGNFTSEEYIFDGGHTWPYNPSSITLPNTLEEITLPKNTPYNSIFNIESVLFEGNNDNFYVEDGCIYSKDKKVLYFIPKGLKNLAFKSETKVVNLCNLENTELEKLDIPNTITTIYLVDNTYLYLPNTLKELEIDANIDYSNYIKINSDYLTKLSFGSNVTSLENMVIDCTYLNELSFSNNLKTLPSITSGSLENIHIPESVEDVTEFTDSQLPKLESITVDEKNKTFKSVDGVLFQDTILKYYPEGKKDETYEVSEGVTEAYMHNSFLKNLKLPNSLTSIDLSLCSNLETINIPENITTFNEDDNVDYTLKGCNKLKNITVDERNQKYTTSNGALYSKDYTTLYKWFDRNTNVPEINNKTTKIEISAFDSYDNVESINLKNVTDVAYGAFAKCKNLKNVNLPNVKTIGDYAFLRCTGLEDINISNGLISIGNFAFYNCTSLTCITIPKSVTSISNNAFNSCKSLIANVYNDSTGLTYCKDNIINYRIIGTYYESNNVQIENESCTNIFESTELKVKQITSGEDYDAIANYSNNFNLYDIAFYKDEEKVEIDGTAIVRIPVKEGMDGNKCKVYYNDNGTYTDMNAVYKDGYMEFKTDHFGQYIVTDSELPTTALGDVNGDGEINFLDAIMVLRYDAEIIELEDNQLKVADVNGDGEVNFLDAIMILRYDAEIIDSF